MAQDTMKGTRAFQDTISQYLMGRAENDPILAIKLANPSKTMEQCCQYIISQVKKSGCCGFSDEEIYGWAMHFWDEPEVEVGEPINCQVVVNHVVELTEEEKAQARKEAIARLRDEEMAKIRKAQSKKASAEIDTIVVNRAMRTGKIPLTALFLFCFSKKIRRLGAAVVI